MLYKEWLDEWLELYVRPSVKERTYEKYRCQAEKYLLPGLGGCELGALTAIRLQKFSASLPDLAASTINGVLSLLKSSLKAAVSLGVTDKQFSDTIIRPKPRGKKVVCFGKGEQKKIEKYILGHHAPHLCGILLTLYTGLRIGELLALTWDDVDLRRGMLTVTKTCYDGWENGHYRKFFDTAKTQSSERVIPLPRRITAYLREIKRSTEGEFVVAGKTEYGAQVRTYQRTFEHLLDKLGIAHKGFHALRHTFATRALEMGMDVKTLAEILGHKNPMMTLQRYAHSLMEHKKEMMDKIGRLLG